MEYLLNAFVISVLCIVTIGIAFALFDDFVFDGLLRRKLREKLLGG